jgi:hypothetical protein
MRIKYKVPAKRMQSDTSCSFDLNMQAKKNPEELIKILVSIYSHTG